MGHGELAGLRILVVEDEFLVAEDLRSMLTGFGATVIGPFSRLRPAVQVAEREPLDGAVLDVGLNGEAVYPLADQLRARHIPFIFATGHDARIFPEPYRTVPQLRKPVRPEKLRRLATSAFKSSQSQKYASTVDREPDLIDTRRFGAWRRAQPR